MRIVTLAVILSAMAASTAAGGSAGVEDPAFDERFSFYMDVQAADCHDAAVDIRGLSVSSNDSTVTVKLAVRDFETTNAECKGVSIPRSEVTHALRFPLLEGSSQDSREFVITVDKKGSQGPGWCVAVRIQIALYSPCLEDVRFTLERSLLTWEISSEGVAPPRPWSEPVPYSLRDNEYFGGANGSSYFPLRDIRLMDSADLAAFRT